MKTIIVFALLFALGLAAAQAYQPTQSDYDKLKSEAERLYADASYGKAREVYL